MPAHAQRWSLVFVSVLLSLALSACGTKQTLEQAIDCGQFKHLPDGTWSTAKDVSLDFLQDGTEHQLNYSSGLIITGKRNGEEALVAASLDKKCGVKQ
jgi:hypothetical protein